MTTPAPPPEAAQAISEPPVSPSAPLAPPPDALSAEEAVVALLAAYVAAQTASAATRAAFTPARLLAAFVGIGIPRPIGRATLRLALEAGVGVPRPPTGPKTAARRAIARTEPIWRARYLMAAAKRMNHAFRDPPRRVGQRRPAALPTTPDLLLPRGSTAGLLYPGQQDTTHPGQWAPERMKPAEAARWAFERERRYLEQHRDAQKRRREAAKAADIAADRWGQILSWVAVRDERTSWDCLRLDGHNWDVADPPGGFMPGMVHPRCRCTAGPPIPGARIIGGTGV